MPPHDRPARPAAPPTLYPRRCFAPPPRPQAMPRDRLLRHIVAQLAPAARPRRRQPPNAPRAKAGARRQPSLREAARAWSNLLGIWRHCDEPLCRTERCCRGDPRSCLPRYLPRLPRTARLWFTCVGVAAEKNMSFAEAAALAEREGEEATCARWQAAVRGVLTAADTACAAGERGKIGKAASTLPTAADPAPHFQREDRSFFC